MMKGVKIIVNVPDNNIEERKYIIHTLFSFIIDLDVIDYVVRPHKNTSNYEIIFGKKSIIIRDSFWNQWKKPLSYLVNKALPIPLFGKCEYISEEDIICLYGYPEIKSNTDQIICNIDIFASSFFMLTRWEEYISVHKDIHQRFSATESIAYKYKFLERPIVNEYAELLKNMLLAIDLPKISLKKNHFEIILTHDIDKMQFASIRNLLGDLIKRRSLKLFGKHLYYCINNPFNTYDYLMSLSEKYGLKSRFYFMASNSNYSYDYEDYIRTKKFRKLVRQIKERKHIIGFHPGYDTYDSINEWTKQKNRLISVIKNKINEGRQHYLRLKIPDTLQIWEDNGMKIDRSLGFADHIGFRCGTGSPFHFFNILSRKKLNLMESPLIIMDGTLRQYMGLSINDAKNRVYNLIDKSKKYEMPITLLFHNSSFYEDWQGYDDVYESIISYAVNSSK